MAAYQNDNSEEAKAKLQELKVSLEDARDNLEETEYDKYVSDQKEMLDDLYDKYEEILNKRLDNVDALLQEAIVATNEDRVTIKQTLETEAKGVGITLGEKMDEIWGRADGVISGVKTAVSDVKTTIEGWIEDWKTQAEKDAKYAEESNAQTLNKNPNSTLGEESAKENKYAGIVKKLTGGIKAGLDAATSILGGGTTGGGDDDGSSRGGGGTGGGDGNAKVGDKVTFAKGKYHAASDGSGATGSAYLKDKVYIVKIKSGAKYPYLIAKKKGDVSGALGWVSKSQLSGYATGKKNFFADEIAWTQENGPEAIVRPSDGAILTPLAKGDSVLNATATGNIWDMANSPADFIRDNLNVDAVNPNASNSVGNSCVQNFENISFVLPNVKNYDQMLAAMQKDKNFERLINAMTVDQIAGKSSLGKGKAIR